MRSKLLVATAVAAFAISACEALVDFDSFDDGRGICDASCGDAEAEAAAQPDADAQVVTIEAGADAVAPPDSGAGCPSGHGPAMVVAAGFCIDSTEVTSADYLAFYSAAKSGNTVVRPTTCTWKTSTHSGCGGDPKLPVACVDWCDAYAYCAWAGKRLCGTVGGGSLDFSKAGSTSASEWSRACSPDGRTYPYGNTIEPGACDTRYVDGGNARGAVPVASLPGCVGGIPGLYDMAGNVEEWIDSCDTHDGGLPSDACHEGGDTFDFAASGTARCDNNDVDQRDFAGSDVGFRCCATL